MIEEKPADFVLHAEPIILNSKLQGTEPPAPPEPVAEEKDDVSGS
jgi:hypothetical protein